MYTANIIFIADENSHQLHDESILMIVASHASQLQCVLSKSCHTTITIYIIFLRKTNRIIIISNFREARNDSWQNLMKPLSDGKQTALVI